MPKSRSLEQFRRGYKAILVDKDSYLLELARYIVLNPVRARSRGSQEVGAALTHEIKNI